MNDLSEIKKGARQDDYPSMEALARAALDAGQTPAEMLRTCYGVSFPAEVHMIDTMRGERRALPGTYANQPWSLLALARGASDELRPMIGEYERRARTIDERLLPLLLLQDDGGTHSGWFVCYRIDELAAGRPTIVALVPDFWNRGARDVQRLGDSLAGVLHEHFASAAKRIQAEYESPSNRGAGSAEEGEVTHAQEMLARADDLVRAVAAASGA